jgi:hypothetical protein
MAIVSGNYIYDPNEDIWETSIETIISSNSNYSNAYIVFRNNLLNVKSYWPALGIAAGANVTAKLILKGNVANVNWFRYKVANGVTLTIHQIDEDQWTKTYAGTPVIYALNRNSGQAMIPANATSVTVSHGLICTPSKVLVTPATNVKAWVSNVTNTSFTINIDTAQSTNVTVYWYAEC